MKKRNPKQKMGLLSLFLQFLAVLFVGFCVCNVLGIVIRCMFNGFDNFLLKIMDLPYLLYFLFSLIISLILIFIMRQKTK